MAIELDHTIVPSHHAVASARQLAQLLGVAWEPRGMGPFMPRYRSQVGGPEDGRINTGYGGSMVYWNEPDGHQWEMLTVSYARPSTALPRA